MTDISSSAERPFKPIPAAKILGRVALGLRAFLPAVRKSVALLPEEFGKAAAMAYVDPFHLTGRDKNVEPRGKDYTDPRNF